MNMHQLVCNVLKNSRPKEVKGLLRSPSFLTMLSALAPQLLFKPTPVCPLCLSHLCRFWWGSGRGAEELFVCAVRASSQEISGDGNSAETSCW